MTKKNLSAALQVFYGFGVSYAICDQIFSQWVLYYYLPSSSSALKPLLSPLFIIVALMTSRLIDMISDPLVGYWSDRVDTKWGRRIPFITAGAIPLMITTVLFFYPFSKSSEIMIFYHLTITGCMFFIFYTIVGAPYNALIPEISHSQSDRLNLSTWQSVFRLIYSAAAMILPGILIKKLGNGNEETGIRYMAVLFSIFAALGIFITSLTIDEKKLSGGKTSREKLFSSLKKAFRYKSFIIYLCGFLFFFTGFNTLRATMNYYVEDIMGMGKAQISIAAGCLFGVTALFFYPVNQLSKKVGYKKLMIPSLLFLVVISLGFFNLGKFIPVSFGFLLFALAGISVSGAAFIFPPAMLSEISAVATHETGIKIEGIFFGIQGFFLKLAFFISIGVLPILLVSGSGKSFVENLIQKPDAVEKAGIYYTALFSAICFLISAVIYYFYPEKILKDE
ncbi:MAG: MFS transporter [Spirochaetes bacterium]|nr:MFS transporter [Spirochaetota bacterium]